MENEANWSLRAVTIRGEGEGSCRGDEADSGSGRKPGSVAWYMRKTALRQSDRKRRESHKWENDGRWSRPEVVRRSGRLMRRRGESEGWLSSKHPWLKRGKLMTPPPSPSQLGTGKNTQERMCAIASTCEVFRQMLIISNVAVTLLSSAQQRFPGWVFFFFSEDDEWQALGSWGRAPKLYL